MTCPHGYPSPLNCLDCMDDDGLGPPPAPPPPQTASRPFAARFASTCRGCGEQIEVGQQVAYMDDDTVRHHPDCQG